MAELRMERRFAASPEKVFAFVTERQNLLQWWGPQNMSASEHTLDLTRPGPWKLVFVGPDGGQYPMGGRVLSVDPPRAVEFTMSVPGTNPVVNSTVRFEITPDGSGGSHFILTQSGITDDMVVMGSRGWVGPLDRLERLLDAST